jgi:hypothetical protein
MAIYCQQRSSRLRNAREREFVDDMVVETQRWPSLTPGRHKWLEDIYVRLGGT